MLNLSEVQTEHKICVADLGYGTNFTSSQVTLKADLAARVIYIGDELVVPIEKVLFMKRAPAPPAEVSPPIPIVARREPDAKPAPIVKAREVAKR